MLAKTGLPLLTQVPRVFRRSKALLRIAPSFIRHFPALVEDGFKDPVFCQRVAGLERMLRVKARIENTPGVEHSPACFEKRDLVADSQMSPVVDDSVVPVASDLQLHVPMNILSDLVLQCGSGVFEFHKRDLEDGIVAVRASTAGDGNHSRLLEVIESVFLCLVTRFENSPHSSLRVS